MINIYTDGACKENLRENGTPSGLGGWAYVILDQEPGRNMEIVLSDSDFVDGTTNQEMEIIAVAKAFEALAGYKSGEKIILYSDSAYVINCLKDRWYDRWNSNGWLNSKLKPVENREAWEMAIDLVNRFDVTFFHVKRNSTRYIKVVDEMAKKASKKQTSQELL